MRKLKQRVRKELTEQGKEQIKTFVELGLKKYNLSDILSVVLDYANNWDDRPECAKVCFEHYEVEDEIKDLVRWDDKMNGWLSVKTDTAVNRDKIEEFILTQVYPYYNQQQTLFA